MIVVDMGKQKKVKTATQSMILIFILFFLRFTSFIYYTIFSTYIFLNSPIAKKTQS